MGISAQVGADGMNTGGGENDPKKAMMKNVFRGLGVAMVPLTMHFPQAVFMYWCTNNTFSLVQTMALKPQPVRDYFGILKPPKPVPGAPDAMEDIGKKIREIMGNSETAGKAATPEVFEQNPKMKAKIKQHKGKNAKSKKNWK